MKETIVRIVVVGSPQRWLRGRQDGLNLNPESPNFDLARKMLERAVDDRRWPATRVLFTVTPGGFIQGRMPEYGGCKSWASRPADFRSLIPTAEEAVWQVIDADIHTKLASRSRFLTVGVDLVAEGQSKTGGGSDTRAELVGVVDLDQGAVIRWTGKSYPRPGQEERVLVQEPCLESHLLRVAGQRVLLLGCHDLNMFSGRAQAKAKNAREQRWKKMLDLARRFNPTMVLHHPHQTDTPRTWSGGWSGLRQCLDFDGPYASGIAYYPNLPKFSGTRRPLPCVLRATKNGDVVDIRVDGYWSREWERHGETAKA